VMAPRHFLRGAGSNRVPAHTLGLGPRRKDMGSKKPASFELQPCLENERIALRPLRREDFEDLYRVASDPLIWEQHPNRDRYRRDVFEAFFEGAMASGGAFLVSDAGSGEVIGSSRYYELDPERGSVAIGYTFLARRCWGTTYNRAMKRLMLDHAFRFVDEVIFHVGERNRRSQIAVERLGARKIGEIDVAYVGEPTKNINFVYRLDARDWADTTRGT
jgi:RimJ/RimL family protein N-acetyltransferase